MNFPYEHPAEFYQSLQRNDPSIKEVTLVSGDTQLADQEALVLGTSLLRHNTHVTSIRIENHVLQGNESVVSNATVYLAPLLQFIRNSPSVTSLSLRHVQGVWNVFLEAASANPHITTLRLQGLDRLIAEEWECLRHIQTLHLSTFLTTRQDQVQVARTLFKSACCQSLQHVSVTVMDEVPLFLLDVAEQLDKNTHCRLRSLTLKSSEVMVPLEISNAVMTCLLRHEGLLQELSLEYFSLDASTLQIPRLSLTNCALHGVPPSHTIRTLHVGGGILRVPSLGVTGFVQALLPGLQELHWSVPSWFYQQEDMLTMIHDILPQSTVLRELKLLYMEEEAAKSLARVLPMYGSLERLTVSSVSGENIFDLTRAFLDGMRQNGSLHTVELLRRRNHPLLDEPAQQEMQRYLARNKHLACMLRECDAYDPLVPLLLQRAFETPKTASTNVAAYLLRYSR